MNLQVRSRFIVTQETGAFGLGSLSELIGPRTVFSFDEVFGSNCNFLVTKSSLYLILLMLDDSYFYLDPTMTLICLCPTSSYLILLYNLMYLK